MNHVTCVIIAVASMTTAVFAQDDTPAPDRVGVETIAVADRTPRRPGPAPRRTPCPTSQRMNVAWEFMASGHYMGAVRHFTREGTRDSTCAGPKIGYAFGSAAMGDLGRGAKSMRQALWLDPATVRAFRLDRRVHPLATKLIDRCLLRLGADDTDKDTAFFLAALYYIIRDEQGSRYAIEIVRGNDDDATSAVHLEELIEERFGSVVVMPEPVVATAPGPLTEPAVVMRPIAEPRAVEPVEPPRPVPPTEPVDYDKLRTNMKDVSDALNSFAEKLVNRIQKAKETLGQQ
jgi:hypothetical protein